MPIMAPFEDTIQTDTFKTFQIGHFLKQFIILYIYSSLINLTHMIIIFIDLIEGKIDIWKYFAV